MQWTITSAVDLARTLTTIGLREDFPFQIIVLKGKEARTKKQNRLVHMWFNEIAQQKGDETSADIKIDCNIAYGRPILARDDPEWDAVFEWVFRDLNIERKRKAVKVLDVPFTRKMSVKQLTEYMDNMGRDYRQQGFNLTDPEDLKWWK